MNQVSTIADSRIPALREKKFDSEAESLKVVEEIVKDVPKDEILVKGIIFASELGLRAHSSTQPRHIWKNSTLAVTTRGKHSSKVMV
jgi:hypothetical protein